jgi:carbonic anhydrase
MKADAVLLACMDFRLDGPIRELLAREGIRTWDAVRLAGGAAALLRPETAEVVREQLALSMRLHAPERIVLTVHRDCGALQRHTSASAEDEALRRLLSAASAEVRRQHPDAAVTTFILDPLEAR